MVKFSQQVSPYFNIQTWERKTIPVEYTLLGLQVTQQKQTKTKLTSVFPSKMQLTTLRDAAS